MQLKSDIRADQVIGVGAVQVKAAFGLLLCRLPLSGVRLEVALLVVDNLDVLVGAAVLLVAAGGQRGRVGLSHRGFQLRSHLGLGVRLRVLGPGGRLSRSSWGLDVTPGPHQRIRSSPTGLAPWL